jgi:hypothetical protein
MAAPAGNRFWELRSKHGRDKLFETPEMLWKSACEYFEWCEDNPLIESKPMSVSIGNNQGSSIEMAEVPKMRAFTWDGLELFIDVYSLRDYKTNPEYKDFSQVIGKIEKIIYNQKFTGAAAGFLNPNIIARDLGLADKVDQKNEISGALQFTGFQIIKPNDPNRSEVHP